MSDVAVTVVAMPYVTADGTDSRVTVLSVDTPITVVSAGFGVQGATGPRGEGRLSTYDAAVPVSGHTVLTLNAVGLVLPADPTDPTHANGIVGISTGAAAEGETASVATSGLLTHSGWTFTPGLPVFIGVAGVITQTPPVAAWQKAVGVALSATSIVIELQPAIFS